MNLQGDTSDPMSQAGLAKFLQGAQNVSDHLAQYACYGRLMYLGLQWMASSQPGSASAFTIQQHAGAADSSGAPLRVVINRIATNIIQSVSDTTPDRLDVDASSPDGMSSATQADHLTQLENIVNAVIEESGMVSAFRAANYHRAVDGMGCVFMRLNADGSIDVDRFDQNNLILDPSQTHPSLRRHTVVGRASIMDIDSFERAYGKAAQYGIKRESLRPISALAGAQVSIATQSHGALYSSLQWAANSPGLVVVEMFQRTGGRRFDRRGVFAGSAPADMKPLGSPGENPYGGVGLPIATLRGHFRPDSICPVSDVMTQAMHQKVQNLVWTMALQAMYDQNNGSLALVDRSFSSNLSSADDVRKAIRSGVLIGNMRDGSPPQILRRPPVDQSLMSLIAQADALQAEQVFKSPGDRGPHALKTHVTATATTDAFARSGKPLEDRVQGDVIEMEQFIHTALCTAIRSVRSQGSALPARLATYGIDDLTLQMARDGQLSPDPDNPPCVIRLRNQAVRTPSRSERIRQAETALQYGAITPEQYRAILAGGTDTPIVEDDRQWIRYARRIGAMVADGQEPELLNPGPATAIVVGELRTMAAVEFNAGRPKRASVIDRLAEAIESEAAQRAAGQASRTPEQPPSDIGPDDILAMAGVTVPAT